MGLLFVVDNVGLANWLLAPFEPCDIAGLFSTSLSVLTNTLWLSDIEFVCCNRNALNECNDTCAYY